MDSTIVRPKGRGRGLRQMSNGLSQDSISSCLLGAGDSPLLTKSTNNEDLCQSINKLSVSNEVFAKKPTERVTIGRSISLFANHFKIRLQNLRAYHYDIDIKLGMIDMQSGEPNFFLPIVGPKEKKMRKLQQKENMEVIAKMVKEWPEVFGNKFYAFDGLKNLYTIEKLSIIGQVRKNVRISLDSHSNESFEVWIQLANEIPLSSINEFYSKANSSQKKTIPEDALHVLEVVLRFKMTQLWTPVSRSLYSNESKIFEPLRDCPNVLMANGHYQSVHITEIGPTLVVDQTATLFRNPIQLLYYITNLSRDFKENWFKYSDKQLSDLSRQLTGIKIKTTYMGSKRTAIIDSVSNLKPIDIDFCNKDIKTNVLKHFEEQYKIQLKYPFLPCIKLRGSIARYLPIEVCTVAENQPISRQHTTPKMTAAIVSRSGQRKPTERFKFIEQTVRTVVNKSTELFEQIGVEICDQPTKLEARVLDKPLMDGFSGKRDNGSKVFDPKPLLHWCFISFSNIVTESSASKVKIFIKQLIEEANRMGIQVNEPARIKYFIEKPNLSQVEKVFEKASELIPGLQLILFCIPYGDGSYHKIKHLGDIKRGSMTQCLKDEHLVNIKRGFIVNFLLKINGKLNGKNSIVKNPVTLLNGLMVIGADVTHPAPADRMTSSVAAVIGSYNQDFTLYSTSIRVQRKSKDEIIKEIGQMIGELLVEYKSHNKNNLPKGLLIFRDGVSEGQFAQVLKYEFQQIKEVCTTFAPNYAPKITFIVVQKRHHTRFMPVSPLDGVGKSGNIPPGTVVDNSITNPILFEYYLCSHSGLIGTSRPSKYVVLHDDHNFTFNEITKISYQLCHSYVQTTGSISIPTPVMYSHLAAKRSKDHIIAEGLCEPQNYSNIWELKGKMDSDLNAKIKVDDKLKNSLYFC